MCSVPCWDAAAVLAGACDADGTFSLSCASTAWHQALTQPPIWWPYLGGPPQALARPFLADKKVQDIISCADSLHPSNYRIVISALRGPGWLRRYTVLKRWLLTGRLVLPLPPLQWRTEDSSASSSVEPKMKLVVARPELLGLARRARPAEPRQEPARAQEQYAEVSKMNHARLARMSPVWGEPSAIKTCQVLLRMPELNGMEDKIRSKCQTILARSGLSDMYSAVLEELLARCSSMRREK